MLKGFSGLPPCRRSLNWNFASCPQCQPLEGVLKAQGFSSLSPFEKHSSGTLPFALNASLSQLTAIRGCFESSRASAACPLAEGHSIGTLPLALNASLSQPTVSRGCFETSRLQQLVPLAEALNWNFASCPQCQPFTADCHPRVF